MTGQKSSHGKTKKQSLLKRFIRFNLAVAIGALIVLTSAVLSWYALSRIEKRTRYELEYKLNTVLNVTHKSLKMWIHNHMNNIRYWTSEPDFLLHLQDHLLVPRDGNSLLNSPDMKHICDFHRPFLSENNDTGFFIVDSGGTNLIAMEDQLVGRINPITNHGDYLESIFKGNKQLILPFLSGVPLPGPEGKQLTDTPVMFIGIPIHSADGSIIAACLVQIDPYADFTKIIHMPRTGTTGDTYAFDKKGRFISEGRFDDQLRTVGLLKNEQRSILFAGVRDPGGNLPKGFKTEIKQDQWPFTKMAALAIAGDSGCDVNGYRDYRGVPVVGAWLWDNELELGITFETDLAEAYESFFMIRQILLTVLSVTLVLFLIPTLVLFKGRKNARKQTATLTDINEQLHLEIAERKRAETQLENYHSRLESIVDDRTRQLTAANEALMEAKKGADSANQLKSEFLANMSHDMRTPLNGILGFTNLMLRKNPDEKSKDYLLKVSKLGDSLLVLISDILDFSQIEAGQLTLSPKTFLFEPFLQKIHSLYALQFQKKNVTFVIHRSGGLPRKVHQDDIRLLQVIFNLLDNAKKFTHQGEVTLSISYAEADDLVIVSVKDTGIGIAKHDLQMIFQSFTQSHSDSPPSERGIGLGLAICQKLVGLMGGDIRVESEIGRGSAFVFSVPANTNHAQEIEVPHAPPLQLDEAIRKRISILVVDDYIVNRVILIEMLQAEGFESILEASDGHEAVDIALKCLPDIILMDIEMSEMDGNDAIKELRESGFDAPILAVSAYALKNEIEGSMQAGADGYVTKPIDFKKLFSLMAKFLK
ncbi:MAG: response regulator [bacterium]|nr:response regulator [bacterium]